MNHLTLENDGKSSILSLVWAPEGRTSGELALLSILSLLNHQSIPERILTQPLQMTKFPHYPTGKDYEDCLKSLEPDRLIEYDQSRGHLCIQKIVQEGIRATTLKGFGALEETYCATARLVFFAWPLILTKELHFSQEIDRISRWKQSNELLAHGESLLQTYKAFVPEAQRICATREFICLFLEITWYQRERGMMTSCLSFMEATFSTFRQSGEAMPDLLSAMHNAGGAIALQINQPAKMLEHYKEYFRVQRDIYAANSRPTTKYAAAYSELGMAYVTNKQYDEEVIQLFDTSASIRQDLPGFKKVDLFNTLRGKGYCYWLRGELEEALRYLLEALNDREQAFGPDDTNGMRYASYWILRFKDTDSMEEQARF